MDKRIRSPNYPALSLSEAIQRVAVLYKNQHTHGAPREVVAKGLGYNTLNGASATAISALTKYGLLEGRGDEIKVSDRAMRILHPENPEEKASAIREAANGPELFNELAQKFPGRLPAEEVLRNYLIRNDFAPSAIPAVIRAYRETNEFVEREAGAYDSAVTPTTEATTMQEQQATGTANLNSQAIGKTRILAKNQRAVAQYPFENGGLLEIVVTGDIPTEEALDWAETLIELKRKEISRNAARAASAKEDSKEE